MQFINDNKLNGILFFTGDRHHSEVIKIDRKGTYPLYDVTSSPLTSGSHKFGGAEKNNLFRVAGIDNIQNYSRITLEGSLENRTLKVEFIDGKGNVFKQLEYFCKRIKKLI
jgi:alkaline phosphatase D